MIYSCEDFLLHYSSHRQIILEIILICWFGAQETLSILISLWKKYEKNLIYLKYKYFVTNVFTITLNQVKVPLLYKSMNFLGGKTPTDPEFLNSTVCIYMKRHSTIFGLFVYKF